MTAAAGTEPGGERETEAARARIARAWDPELFRDSGAAVVQQIAQHLNDVQNRDTAVLNWAEPLDNIAAAAESLRSAPVATTERIAELTTQLLSSGQNLHHPGYIGHQVATPSPIAGLFDAIGAITNQVMGVYEMGPFTTAIERAVAAELGQRIGWAPGTFSGVVTHGGSLANLTALLAARNLGVPDSWSSGLAGDDQPCFIANADAHYSISRAAGIMGVGAENLVAAPLNASRSIETNALDALIDQLQSAGRRVIAVAASSCSTPTGAFDDLNAMADVCEKHNVWFHVDAAHGGGALFSKRHRHRLDGIARADSVVWDAHKMLAVPALCAFVFFRQRSHGVAAFRQDAPYLFDDEHPDEREFDSATRTLECTKRAAALGIWGLWSLFGPQLFEDLVDLTFALTRRFCELLSEAPEFECPWEPQANILVFRFRPDGEFDQKQLNKLHSDVRRELIRAGQYYIVQTEIDGVVWLRVTVMNPLTTEADLVGLMQTLREMFQKRPRT